MSSLEVLMQDFDLLFSSVLNTNTYHFKTMADVEIKYPVIDQRFNDDEQQIIIAATGASKDDFEIRLRDDILSVKRVNSGTSNPTKYKYVKNDISRKKFDIAFKIPKKWDVENLTVDLEKGELIITIPVKEESKPKIKEFSIK